MTFHNNNICLSFPIRNEGKFCNNSVPLQKSRLCLSVVSSCWRRPIALLLQLTSWHNHSQVFNCLTRREVDGVAVVGNEGDVKGVVSYRSVP